MKNFHRFLLVGAACAVSASVALADVPGVSLEYAGSSRVQGTAKPIITFKNYTSVEKGRIRKLTKYVINAPKMSLLAKEKAKSPMAFLAHAGAYHAGGIGVMIDRDNDKFMVFSSEAKTYIEQPYREFLKQIRFDPFSKVAPKLSKEAPPELTKEQRQRLGAEVNVVAKAFLKKNVKVYFHPLPKSRNFKVLDGVATHGYRMTMLFNMAKPGQPTRWGKVASEWWVADSLPGDDMFRDITGGLFDDIKSDGGISTSMWINEALPLIWNSLPHEMRDAVQTIMPLPPAKDAWYKGTLVYLAVTADLRKTKSAHPVISRTEITLKKRSTATIPTHVFLPPAGYQKMDIDFLLTIYKSMSASILDPNGPIAQMVKSGKMPMKMPFGETMPLLSSLEPVVDSPFASNFKEAVRPRW
jgi:hypothetical protein